MQEAGGSPGVQGQAGLQVAFRDSQGHTEALTLKTNK